VVKVRNAGGNEWSWRTKSVLRFAPSNCTNTAPLLGVLVYCSCIWTPVDCALVRMSTRPHSMLLPLLLLLTYVSLATLVPNVQLVLPSNLTFVARARCFNWPSFYFWPKT